MTKGKGVVKLFHELISIQKKERTDRKNEKFLLSVLDFFDTKFFHIFVYKLKLFFEKKGATTKFFTQRYIYIMKKNR